MACVTQTAMGGKDLILKRSNGMCSAEAVTFTAATDLVNLTAHGLIAGQLVRFATVVTSAVPAVSTDYYVIASGLTADAFKVSTTAGGTTINIDVDGTGTMAETFQTIAGMREPSISIEGEEIEITNQDSSQWKELLNNAGIKSGSISGSGIAFDEVGLLLIRADALSGALNHWRLYQSSADYYSGTFKLTSFEHSGPYNDAQAFSMSLASSGAIAFTNA